MAENKSTLEPHFRGSGTRRRVLAGLAVLAALGTAFFAGRASRSSHAEGVQPGPRRILYYADPMHPSYRAQRPGKAPDCGMDLVPVFEDGQPANSEAMNPGSVRLTPDQEELIQLETETLRPSSGERQVETVGRVVPDETMTSRVSAGTDGWVRRVFSDQTGTYVKKGQELAAFYSKDVSAPQQAYVFALESYERLNKAASAVEDQLELARQQLAIARDNLQFMGMGEAQIEELGRSHREIFDVNLTAPDDGQILERNVAVGQRFMKGEVLYRIANLSRVWVLADVYASDAALMGHIRRAKVTIEGLAPMEASVGQAPLQIDGGTGKLRLEVKNEGRRLVPGMIVNVAFSVAAGSAMTLSVDAVLDSGAKKRVFVAMGEGRYELREVETGWRDGDRVAITSGLKEGEKVVTTGAFLLDSESRLKNPELREQGTARAADEVTDPACGMKIDRSKARRLIWKGATYYFSSASCQAKFEAHPQAYLSSGALPTK